jgi:predicted urease superfamily metal-dependent hydrolase
MSCRADLLITDLRFQINPNENGFRKIKQKFKRDPTVGSKVLAILTRHSSLADETSSSLSSDYIETP